MAHAQTIKKFSPSRQAQIKFKIAKLIMEEEIASLEENSSQFTCDNNSTSSCFSVGDSNVTYNDTIILP